jgi:hypothetical protein
MASDWGRSVGESRLRLACAAGSTAGPHASQALPALRAARGTGDAHLDHLLAEAVFWIERGRPWPSSEACEPLSVAQPDRLVPVPAGTATAEGVRRAKP